MKVLYFIVVFGLIMGLALYVSENYCFHEWESIQGDTKKQIESLKSKNDANEKYRLDAVQLEAETRNIEARYREIENMLPGDDQVDEIFNSFTKAAQSNRLAVGSFDNKHRPFKPGLNESPFSIELNGTGSVGHQNFLKWVGAYPQLVVIQNASIKLISPPNQTTLKIKGAIVVDIPDKKKTT